MDITIQAYNFPNYRFGGTTAKMIFRALAPFISSTGQIINAGNDENPWELVIDCTVANNELSAPEFVLPATTDSSDPDVKYSLSVITEDLFEIENFFLSEFQLTHELGNPLTWEQIFINNQARVVRNAKDTFPTSQQVNALFRSMFTDNLAPDASTTIKGKVLLSKAGTTTALGANEKNAVNGVAPLDDNAKVTLATVQNISTQKLLGRSTTGDGIVEQLTIGFGLILVDGELSVDIDAIIPGPSTPELSGEIDTLSYVYDIDTPSIDPNTDSEVGHYLLILSAPEG